MNDNQTNERLAQAAQVKRIFDMIDDVESEDTHSEMVSLDPLRDELTGLLRSLGVEVVR